MCVLGPCFLLLKLVAVYKKALGECCRGWQKQELRLDLRISALGLPGSHVSLCPEMSLKTWNLHKHCVGRHDITPIRNRTCILNMGLISLKLIVALYGLGFRAWGLQVQAKLRFRNSTSQLPMPFHQSSFLLHVTVPTACLPCHVSES